MQEEILEEFLDTQELARRTNTTEAWWAKRRLKPGGPAFIKCGSRTVLYRWSDVQSWLTSRTRTSTSDRGAQDQHASAD